MKNALNSLILKTSIWTLLTVFALTSYGAALFGMVYPSSMTSFADSLGANNASGMFHERVYNRTSNPEDLYLAIDKYIISENETKIIELIPILLADESYGNIIAEVNQYKFDRAENDVDRALVSNEDDRLRRAYVKALLKKDKKTESVQFFERSIETIDLSAPSYMYFAFEDNDLTDCFLDYFDKFVDEYNKANLTAQQKIVPLFFISYVNNWLSVK